MKNITPDRILIAADMDGTFLDKNGKIPECNLEAVERFKKAGGRFTVSTGRYGKKLGELFPGYEKYVNAPVISCNGAYMYDAACGDVLFELSHASSWAVPLLHRITKKFGDNLEIYTVLKKDGAPFGTPYDMKTENEYEYYKVVFSSAPEKMPAIRRFIEENGDGYFISNSAPGLVEILDPCATKGTCINRMRDYYRGNGEDIYIIGVGDYENDLCMLNAADCGACPENATDEVKAVCGIRLCHCNDGAINDLVNKILKSWRTV